MTSPIDLVLNGVEWEPVSPPEANADGLPFVTHSGVLTIGNHFLRCHQLNNGMRVFDADDIAAFFGGVAP